jgi:hypothetical protein
MMVECTPLRQCLRPPPASGIDPSLLQTVEVFERLPAERPAHDTLDAIAEWLIGPARRIASGTCALDEFAWRLLAAGPAIASGDAAHQHLASAVLGRELHLVPHDRPSHVVDGRA